MLYAILSLSPILLALAVMVIRRIRLSAPKALFLSLLLGREQDAWQWLASVEHAEGLAAELTALLRDL